MPTTQSKPSLFERIRQSIRPPALRFGLFWLLLLLGLYLSGNRLLDNIELKTYDLRLLAHPARESHTDVAIVAIDEKSLAALGRWPWSRATLAQLIDRLDATGARVIALDVLFPEPENRAALDQIERLERGSHGGGGAYLSLKRMLATDHTLATAIARSHKVVLPMAFLLNEEESRHQGAAERQHRLETLEPYSVKIIQDRGNAKLDFPMPAAYGVVSNLPELTRSARSVGHINVLPDDDGVVRWTQLVMRHGDLFVPSADLQAVRLFLGNPELVLHTAYGIRHLQLGSRQIGTDETGRALIHYRNGPKRFPVYSAADVLAGTIDANGLRDKIILIGPTATGLGDVRATPIDALLPGVEIRATTIQNLLDNDFIQRPGWMFLLDLLVMLSLGLMLATLLPRMGFRTSTLVTLTLAAAYLLLAILAFNTQQTWYSVVYPVMLLLLLFVSATLVHYIRAEREKREVKRAFQHYVAPQVVDRILLDVDQLALGGEKRELTVLFSDIRGFTGIAESLAPETLVTLLNEYLTRMTDQVFRQEGLLDKYIGDALLAVYGAPIAHPDHAQRACRTALDMVRTAWDLQNEWRAQGLPAFELGIGINTGPMIVGNMGSKTRFDYTVIGDAVNLGSRIESLNKQYGSRILLSEFTWQRIKDEFPHTREVDRTTVRGRTEPVRLFELLVPEQYPNLDWLKDYARAYDLYRADLRVQARTVFRQLAEDLSDPVSRYYAERCQEPRRRRGD